jgi:hypothetical protein
MLVKKTPRLRKNKYVAPPVSTGVRAEQKQMKPFSQDTDPRRAFFFLERSPILSHFLIRLIG